MDNPIRLRFITVSSLFDGHDAAINVMRQIMQSYGTEVIHMVHDSSVAEVVIATIQKNVQRIVLSSYHGGHVEYFKYMVDMLRSHGAGHIKIFGGGEG